MQTPLPFNGEVMSPSAADVPRSRVAAAILSKIAESDGNLTWYNIVRTVDRLGLESIPPPFAVLQALQKQGFVSAMPPSGGNDAKYSVTPEGHRLLAELEAEHGPRRG
jgi:DNA-binding PadR family transcriptional regulator